MENNCNVLSTTDNSHVSQSSPLDLKRREIKEAQTLTEPALRAKEKQTSERRETSDARPLGGVK